MSTEGRDFLGASRCQPGPAHPQARGLNAQVLQRGSNACSKDCLSPPQTLPGSFCSVHSGLLQGRGTVRVLTGSGLLKLCLVSPGCCFPTPRNYLLPRIRQGSATAVCSLLSTLESLLKDPWLTSFLIRIILKLPGKKVWVPRPSPPAYMYLLTERAPIKELIHYNPVGRGRQGGEQ